MWSQCSRSVVGRGAHSMPPELPVCEKGNSHRYINIHSHSACIHINAPKDRYKGQCVLTPHKLIQVLRLKAADST